MGDLRNKDDHTGMSRLVDVNDGFESWCQRVESRTPDMGDKVQEMPGRSLTENRIGRLVSG